MSQPLILVDRDLGITRVTLNRPEALNALSTPLRNAITETFFELADDPATEVIILTGAGRAFTVGLDLKELGGERDPGTTISSRNLSDALAAVRKPVIGAINGFAITGGFELALMCDFLIASTEARFADTHARVGVVPGWGLSQRLPRLIGINRAKELSLTGNFLDAQTACAWGLVNRVVTPEDLLPTCESLARDIISTEPVTRAEILRIMDAGWDTTLAEGLDMELKASTAHGRAEVTADKVAARRADIQSRGRDQSR
ncbi:MAG: enoyl-CoA hydratase [Pseudomonadales bacterium]|nr:enoyl-CoA hydratase [Pseudomonadales bacterium]